MAPLRPSRRSSRVSSPAVRSSSAAPSPKIGMQSTIDEVPSDNQSTLDAWIEPPLRSRTAFEDAGMEKSALFENMQPLGTLPNPAKLKYKLLSNRATTDKRQPFRPWVDNNVSTPELTPPVEVEVEVLHETNGEVRSPSRAESAEKEAFPLLNGTHAEEPDASTPPLAHDEVSIATLSPRSPAQNVGPAVVSAPPPVAAVTPPPLYPQEIPPQQTTPAPQASRLAQEYSSANTTPTALPRITEKVMADSVYNANQRAQIDGKEALGEAMVGLYQVAKQPAQRMLYDALLAVCEKRATAEQQHLFGISLKQQRAIAKHKLRQADARSQLAGTNSVHQTKTPDTTQSSTPTINHSATFNSASSAPNTPVLGSVTSAPSNPPMGNFHTTPSRPVAKALTAALLRTPQAEQKTNLPPSSTPLQPSPRITSRKSSNAKRPGSPAVLGKRRREKSEVTTPDATEVTPRAKRRAISDATKDSQPQSQSQVSRAEDVKVNGTTATTTRVTRARRSMGLVEQLEPASKPSKTVPQTPPARTRSGRRRQSSSDLSSVDEEVVDKELPAPGAAAAAAKRTAAEIALDESAEETERRRRPFNERLTARQSEYASITQASNIRSPMHPAPREQTLKINVSHGRNTRSSEAQRNAQRAESAAPLTPGLPSPNTAAINLGTTTRTTRSQLINAEQLLTRNPPKPAGARVKISPVKERSSAAGVSRNAGYGSSPSRPGSPTRGGKDDDMGDDGHSEYCLACGGGGRLICCDECTNAMHLKCCDPPIMKPSEYKNKPFFCHECKVQEQRQVDELNRQVPLLRPLFERLARTNTLSFQLPLVVQRYFEGVKAQDNGEYSDDSKKTVSLNRRNAAGWEELGENGRPRERDIPRLMRCKACGESSYSGRTIIQCDDCSAQWHLDCLDPPQANPPSVNNINRTRAFFRCPLHVENDLKLIGNPRLAYGEGDGVGQRSHRLRKARRVKAIKPVVQRGNKNSGIIEVELEDEEEPVAQQDGVVYKLSESAIKLDFLEKAYADRATQERRATRTAAPSLEDVEAEIARRVEEQVAERMAVMQQRQAALEQSFLSRSVAEQDLLRLLVGLSQEERVQLERDNLDVLTRAAAAASEEAAPKDAEVADTEPMTIDAQSDKAENVAETMMEQPMTPITPGTANDNAPVEISDEVTNHDDAPPPVISTNVGLADMDNNGIVEEANTAADALSETQQKIQEASFNGDAQPQEEEPPQQQELANHIMDDEAHDSSKDDVMMDEPSIMQSTADEESTLNDSNPELAKLEDVPVDPVLAKTATSPVAELTTSHEQQQFSEPVNGVMEAEEKVSIAIAQEPTKEVANAQENTELSVKAEP